MLVALVVGGVRLVFFSRYLSVQSVQVTGTGLLSADDIRSAAEVPDEQPLARVDVAAIERRVEALAPVADAEVLRQWPDRVLIRVTERTPIAVVVIGGSSVAGGFSNVPGLWGAALFLFLVVTMLNTYGFGAGIRYLATGLIIIAVIVAASGRRAERA